MQFGIPGAILAGTSNGIIYEIPEGIFEGTSAVIPKGMLTRTLERNLSGSSKTAPIEIPEGIPGGFIEGILRGISDRILRGISAESLVGIPEIITRSSGWNYCINPGTNGCKTPETPLRIQARIPEGIPLELS